MILGDIRIQLLLSVIAFLVLAAIVMPGRRDGVYALNVMLVGTVVGAVIFASIPTIYTKLGPLPTGPAAADNIWVQLANARDNPSLFVLTALALYVVVGIVWAMGYFVLYARRLGQAYVLERDSWMKSTGVTSLEGLSEASRTDFTEMVLKKIQSKMLYEGDFPLNAFQQKRFFVANFMLWPATLLWYLVGNLTVDVARNIWFAFRNTIQRQWDAGMAEYLADDATVRTAMQAAQKA